MLDTICVHLGMSTSGAVWRLNVSEGVGVSSLVHLAHAVAAAVSVIHDEADIPAVTHSQASE